MQEGTSNDDEFMENKLHEFAAKICTKEDFHQFLLLLIEDLRDDNKWENSDLKNYLTGLEGSVYGMEGYYKFKEENIDFAKPTWKMFAQLLLSARVYE